MRGEHAAATFPGPMKDGPFAFPQDTGHLDIFAIRRGEASALDLLRTFVGAAIVDAALIRGEPYLVGAASGGFVHITTAADEASLLKFYRMAAERYAGSQQSMLWHIPTQLDPALDAAIRSFALTALPAQGNA